MTGTIYGLADPLTDEVRYIGRTLRKPMGRYVVHMNDRADTYKVRWIRNLTSAGLAPKLVILEDQIEPAAINERECYWIAFAREAGWRLTNGTRGGDGLVEPTEYTRARMSAAWKTRPPMSEETRRKLSEAQRRVDHTPRNAAVRAGVLAYYTDEQRQAKSERMKQWWAERKAQLTNEKEVTDV